MITLKDVAERCQLSMTQVSRALNNHSDVSEKTKEFVQKTAKEMNYVKNLHASNLATKTTNLIAVIIVGLEADSNEILSTNILYLLRGINIACCDNGFEPLIYMKNRKNNSDYVDFCKQHQVSGVIVFGCNYDDPSLISLQNSNYPCVTIDIKAENESNGCVIVNDSYYAQQAVVHLIQQGCKNIACLKGFELAMVTIERLSGYKMALLLHKIEYREELIKTCDFDAGLAKEMTSELLNSYPEVDGIFCMSDQIAFGCLEAIRDLNIKVPEEIKIFGFDGFFFDDFISPPLSTIAQDFTAKGKAAVTLLDSIIKGDPSIRTIVIPCRIIIRRSSCLDA